MNDRPSAHLKAAASELAALIYAGSQNKKRIQDLQKELDYGQPLPAPAMPPLPDEQNGGPGIGIWKPVIKKGSPAYERDIYKKIEWAFWADVHTLYPVRTKKRIVLLGESVARGYFYDPFYTVAKELQGILTNNPGAGNSEVIDLAKNSIQMDELLKLVHSCVHLNPEAVIIYAGNNWAPKLSSSLTQKDYDEILAIFRRSSFEGVRSFLEERFAAIIKSFLAQVKEVLVNHGIPVIFIIPAFNLKDWRSDDTEKSLLWLPEENREAWLNARNLAIQSKAQHNTKLFVQAATRMSTIDPSNPEGHEWLAEALILQGKWTDAAHFLELARDTVLLSKGMNSKPRCYGIIRRTLLEQGGEYGILLLDATKVCQLQEKNNLPGRELFLDYCHHTVKGIKLVMQHAAAIVLHLFQDKMVPAEKINPSDIYPADDTVAIAHFSAAIHNAHYGQGHEIVNYHCRKAIALSPVVKEPMVKYADFSTRLTSTVLCQAFEDIIVNGRMRQYEGALGLTHPRRRKLMDIVLIDAIVHKLQAEGVDIIDYISRLRKKEHAIHPEGTDLLDSFYSRTSYNEFNALPAPAYLQARTTETRFYFVADKNQALTFRLSYRTPGSTRKESMVDICFNDQLGPARQLPMSSEWVTVSFTVEENLVKEGVNRLTITWPYVFAALSPKVGDFDSPVIKLLYPVLGEINGFYAFSDNSTSPKLSQLSAVRESPIA